MRIALLLGVAALTFAVPAWAQKPDVHKRTRSIRLEEKAGLARAQQVVEATLRFERDALKDPSMVRLLRVEGDKKTPVPCQVLDVTPFPATDSFAPVPQAFVQVLFRADVPALGVANYEVVLEAGKPPAPADPLLVTGDGVARVIDTRTALFDLHSSGQLLSCTPKAIAHDRLVFQQFKDKAPIPIHWNPDIWAVGPPWGHTNGWNQPVAFDTKKHQAQSPPAGDDKSRPFYYREWNGPIGYRLTRWGVMPHSPQAVASVTYTFAAGLPVCFMQSLVEVREDFAIHAIRNAELVFSRHQFDTAVWLAKDGKLHHVPCYDHNDKDKSFGDLAKLPPDVPGLGFANERKGYGAALINLSVLNQNKFAGPAGDEQAHFYMRDYDEHGKGSPANFLYFVRAAAYREGYLPTTARAGSLYGEQSAFVLFKLLPEPAKRFDEMLRWQKILSNPLVVVVD